MNKTTKKNLQRLLVEALREVKKELQNSGSGERTYFVDIGKSFRLIFKTSQGSTYFITYGGNSIRFKQGAEKAEPTYEAIFFITEGESQRISEIISPLQNLDALSGQKIVLTDCRIGVCPLEINVLSEDERIVHERKGDFLLLKGTKVGDAYKPDTLFGSIHIGHPITEIIKDH